MKDVLEQQKIAASFLRAKTVLEVKESNNFSFKYYFFIEGRA
jgi:hypothetical protein